MSKPVTLALKVLVTAILFYWVLAQIQFDGIQEIFKSLDPIYFVFATLSHGVAFLILSLRWWILYRVKSLDHRYSEVLGSYYLGLFFNNILPTGMGGDVVRILRLRQRGLNTHFLTSSTVLDRIIGLTSIVLMGLVALLFIPNVDLAHNIRISLAVCIAVIPLVYFLLFSTYVERMTKKLSILFANNRILSFLFKTILVLHEYRNNRPIILASLCLSIIAQYLIIICYIFLGLCLNIGLPISYYIPIVPVVFLATSLPISIGGLGVRESVLVYLLTLFNVDTQAAIALSLLYFLILVILTLPGGLILLSEQRAKTGTIVN